ncbi:MAG: glutamate-cysteine ligase family protein [Chitinispirillaceae bacterium]|jgi:gamma-glutamyl:cysteine ligase YbdK (ATP-grasp superfamily)
MNSAAPAYHLFSRFGIEAEYMIVDRGSLAVKPIADRLIRAAAGNCDNEIARGPAAWSNELALHCIEIKTNGPVVSLQGLGDVFLENVREANRLLEGERAALLGSGMHPFMVPERETKLWPHGNAEIYRTFDRIFSCSRHGWANLQSVHVNLPFANDEEFGRLHAAVRLVLPVIPALAAASPICESRPSGFSDTRLEAYRTNSIRIPSMTGTVIPEAVFSRSEYEGKILAPLYRDLAPYDTGKILQEEWANARGAIARFERNTIEIRVIDSQETPSADLAVAAAIIGAIKLLTQEHFSPLREQKKWAVAPLHAILLDTIKNGEWSVVSDTGYLRMLGVDGGTCTGRDIWKKLVKNIELDDPVWIAPHKAVLEQNLAQGTLSSRILKALGSDVSVKRIGGVYRKLCECLQSGQLFLP